MIDPTTIDPIALPSVPLENRRDLPVKPCIYFAIDSQGIVQYIGRSINPKNRWKNHQRKKMLLAMGGVRIAYVSVDPSLLSEVEKALIQWFAPPLNNTPIPCLRSPRRHSGDSARVSLGNRATISGTVEQIKIWRAKRDQLGVTDAELLRHILPMLDQIKLKGVQ